MCNVDLLSIIWVQRPLVPYRFCLATEYPKPTIRLYYQRNFKDKIELKELVCEVVDDFIELNLLWFLIKIRTQMV